MNTEILGQLTSLADDRDRMCARLAAIEDELRLVVTEVALTRGTVEGARKAFEAHAKPHSEGLLDTKALAERWGVSVRTIDSEVSEGHVVPTFVRGSRRFTIESVRDYERAHTGPRRRPVTAPAKTEETPAQGR